MASYLRPRRGKKATAVSQAIVLKRGEVFFETPTGGVGTGLGKIKMGDGSTAYDSLPYFLEQSDLDDDATKIAFTNTTDPDTDPYTSNAGLLGNIIPTNSVKTLFTNLKHLLVNYNSQLTNLNNDLGSTDISSIGDGTCHGAISTINSNLSDNGKTFRFGYDGDSDSYGYYKADDSFVPFKTSGFVECVIVSATSSATVGYYGGFFVNGTSQSVTYSVGALSPTSYTSDATVTETRDSSGNLQSVTSTESTLNFQWSGSKVKLLTLDITATAVEVDHQGYGVTTTALIFDISKANATTFYGENSLYFSEDNSTWVQVNQLEDISDYKYMKLYNGSASISYNVLLL